MQVVVHSRYLTSVVVSTTSKPLLRTAVIMPLRNVRGFLATDTHDAEAKTLSWCCKQALTETSHPLIVTLMRNTFPVAPKRQRSDHWWRLLMVLMCVWVWVSGQGCVWAQCVCVYMSAYCQLTPAFIFMAALCVFALCCLFALVCADV